MSEYLDLLTLYGSLAHRKLYLECHVKFLLQPKRENVNISYIIGRPAMMGKADRLPP